MDGAFDPLPRTVALGGRDIPIEPDFRVFVLLEDAALRGDEAGMTLALSRFYQGGAASEPGAAEAFLRFYRCGEVNDTQGGTGGGRRCYDFMQDADALCASFLQAYGLDLNTDEIHWWKFRKLMFHLPQETPFMQRVHYRTADTSGMGRAEKKFYAKMRERFALKAPGQKPMTLGERDQWMKDYVAHRLQGQEGR